MAILCGISFVLFITCLFVPFYKEQVEIRKRKEREYQAIINDLLMERLWLLEYGKSVKYAAPYLYHILCFDKAKYWNERNAKQYGWMNGGDNGYT